MKIDRFMSDFLTGTNLRKLKIHVNPPITFLSIAFRAIKYIGR